MKLTTIITPVILMTAAIGLSPDANAKPNINDMQTCQGLLDFIDYKMDTAPKKYAKADVKAVRKGMAVYNDYIQSEIVTPGLLDFNGGDKGKAKAMQKQVDDYKMTVVAQYKKRFPQDRVFMDHAISVNNCAKTAVPSGAPLEQLKIGLETLVKLSQQN